MRHAYGHSDRDCHIHSHANCDGNCDIHPNGDCDGNCHVHSNCDCDGNAHADGDCYSNCYGYGDRNSNCDRTTAAFTDAKASPNTAAPAIRPVACSLVWELASEPREFPGSIVMKTTHR